MKFYTQVNESKNTKELFFGADNSTFVDNNEESLSLDIIVPVILIIAGIFIFILRKWISPVSSEFIENLENSIPSQGLIYMPEFGAVLIIIGIVLLIVFNI